jgi:cytochrome c553
MALLPGLAIAAENPDWAYPATPKPAPLGSLLKGKTLVTSGGSGQTIPCAICHGASLKGLGEVPGIVGRPPIYVVRQLNDMQNGNRTGSLAELMKAVVAKLTSKTWWRSPRTWGRSSRRRQARASGNIPTLPKPPGTRGRRGGR